jgi:glycosyltransferase involved in cell wall biosynthesis
MRISYNTDPGNFNPSVGYGHAGQQIVQSLQRLGHEVPWGDMSAPVEIWFCQPEYWEFSNPNEGQYKIGYWPWESTKLHDSWFEYVKSADELWTTSYWCKDVYEKELGVPVRVYEHGIDHIWQPVDRRGRGKLKFLHVGEPAVRKSGQMVVDAFMREFGMADDVHLTIKAHEVNTTRLFDHYGSIIGTPKDRPNMTLITDNYDDAQMIELFQEHDVLVYPSWGEGFGFIPLQALATGMPTICTSAWAPYNRFLGPLGLDSNLVDSPWEPWHTGQMYQPNEDHLQQLMRKSYDEWDVLERQFNYQSPAVHARYDWDTLTEKAFRHIVKKFGN